MDGISFIIPAYNEEGGIGRVLLELIQLAPEIETQSEIIVIDDGSTDRTADEVRAYPAVNLLQHYSNRGYGAAIKTGIRRARYDLVCITDGDGTYPSGYISELIKHQVEMDCDMVVGARTGGNVSIPLIRQPAKWAVGKLANLVANTHIPDINSGLRLFRRSIALQFFGILPDGFSFTTTITLGMLTNGYNVEFIPIDYFSRIGKSKIRPIRDTLNFFQLILRIALFFAPLRLFLPISGIVFLIGALWGLYSYFVLGLLADVSTIVITMAALQIAAIGLLAELINKRLPNIYQGKN
ncbi:glycosyltransferase family 2 protein [Chloroflexota bacterium]